MPKSDAESVDKKMDEIEKRINQLLAQSEEALERMKAVRLGKKSDPAPKRPLPQDPITSKPLDRRLEPGKTPVKPDPGGSSSS